MNSENQSIKHELVKRFADHLITVFTIGLLCLWLFATRDDLTINLQRNPWWHYLLLSVFTFLLWLFWARKKIQKKIINISSPFFLIGFVWILYWVSGISIDKCFFLWVACILFLWTIMLQLAMILSMFLWNKLSRILLKGAIWENNSYWPVPLVGFIGIFQSWAELRNVGMDGCWMDLLLYLALIIFIVVALVHVLAYKFEKYTNNTAQ
jgi:glycosyltransferase involved in cell wall biosynthesis